MDTGKENGVKYPYRSAATRNIQRPPFRWWLFSQWMGVVVCFGAVLMASVFLGLEVSRMPLPPPPPPSPPPTIIRSIERVERFETTSLICRGGIYVSRTPSGMTLIECDSDFRGQVISYYDPGPGESVDIIRELDPRRCTDGYDCFLR